MRGVLYRLLTAAAVLAFVGTAALAQPADAIRQALHASGSTSEVEQFYALRSYEAAWTGRGAADDLHQALMMAHRSGLDTLRYHLTRFRGDAAGRDVRWTEVAMELARHMLGGRVKPQEVVYGWNFDVRERDLPTELASAVEANTLAAFYASLQPQHPDFRRLVAARASLEGVRRRGGWTAVPAGGMLEKGDESPRVNVLRKRLTASGDLDPGPGASGSSSMFDTAVEHAVRRFQQRHGLEIDGIVGPQTLAALNRPVEARIEQVDANLERWRWLPERLESDHVRINVAGFELAVAASGRDIMKMRAIVGTPQTRTPLFTTSITEVVLAPYWYVPRSIEVNEILPRAAADRDYLSRHHFRRTAEGVLRQDPGPTNPMGRVKFTIPNAYGVGLHDTSEPHLFARTDCAFSHGCIRVEHPIDLAAHLLSETQWTRDRIEDAIATWRQTRIRVARPVALYVLYWTAWVEVDGTMHFRRDLYGYDDRLEHLLSEW